MNQQELLEKIKEYAKYNKHIFVFEKTAEPVKRPDSWERMTWRDKENFTAYMIGTNKGRNLISTAIAFFLKYAEMSGEEKDISELYRDGLFNCEVKKDRGIRKDK